MKKQKRLLRNLAGIGIGGLLALLLWYFLNRITTDIYSVKAANKTMSEYLDHKELKKIATNYTYGGTFPKSQFQVSTLDSGIVMWYCFNPKQKKFFMAIEKNKLENYPFSSGPGSGGQIVSRALTRYKGESVSAILDNDNTLDTALYDKELGARGCYRQGKDSTDMLTKEFKNLLKTHDNNNDLKQFTRFAFFQNNEKDKEHTGKGLLQQLCDQPNTKYIRYYFGCDSDLDSARIRIILFSVDEKGKNILTIDQSKGSDALVVQRSIPPN